MGDAPGETPGERWHRVARHSHGTDYAQAYAARFDALAAAGQDVHGEATFVAGLVPAGSRVLDAGCGTGRVGVRLDELGFAVVGVDADPAMIEVAVERTPHVPWHVADLAGADPAAPDVAALDLGLPFDLVVAAGNVVPLMGVVAVPAAVGRLAGLLRPGGLLVAGFGLGAASLPVGVQPVPLAAYDEACLAAGLRLVARHGGWDSTPFEGGSYVVCVHAAAT